MKSPAFIVLAAFTTLAGLPFPIASIKWVRRLDEFTRGAGVDLHMHDGHELPAFGRLEMAIAVTGDDPYEVPYYFLAIGARAGTTSLPASVRAPVVLLDPLVISSITRSLSSRCRSNAASGPESAGA